MTENSSTSASTPWTGTAVLGFREFPDPESAAGLSILRRVCVRYGILGAIVGVPFAVIGIGFGGGLAVGAVVDAARPPWFFTVMIGAFVLWTFVIPAVVSLFLLSAAWSIRTGRTSGPGRFLRAYGLMRLGCVFSFMPFLVLAGIWWSGLMVSGIVLREGHWPASMELPFIVWSLTALAVGYYMAFFRLRRIRDKLFVRRSDATD